MTTTTSSAAIVPAMPVFTNTERLALAGFLAGYSGLTREAYALDLRQFASWCHQHHLRLFGARRADFECFARDLEARGRARATIAGLYRYAVEEELPGHSPAAHVRRPRLDYESHATGLDRNELGALLVAVGLGPPAEHALISLLASTGCGLRSHRRQHPGPRRRARSPDPGDHPQGRQYRHHPARPADGAGDRPGHRRALRGTSLHRIRWPTAGPAWCRADRPPDSPPRRDHQARRAAHPAARVHHRGTTGA